MVSFQEMLFSPTTATTERRCVSWIIALVCCLLAWLPLMQLAEFASRITPKVVGQILTQALLAACCME